MEVIRTQRKSRVLVPSTLPCLAGMPTVNLTAGCAHGCLYCYAQGYCSYPGRGRIVLYANLREELRRELAQSRRRPEAIYFSPSSDLFQPVPEVLDLGYDVLQMVLERGIGVVFLTKGKIPRRHLELLAAHAPRVRAGIGIITLDRRIARALRAGGGLAPGPAAADRAAHRGGHCHRGAARPDLARADRRSRRLARPCGGLGRGRRVRNSPPAPCSAAGRAGALRRRLGRSRDAGPAAGGLRPGQASGNRRRRGTVLALPAARRRRIFDWLTAIAQQYALSVHVCACKNPDLAADLKAEGFSPVCHRGVMPCDARPPACQRQLALFGRRRYNAIAAG